MSRQLWFRLGGADGRTPEPCSVREAEAQLGNRDIRTVEATKVMVDGEEVLVSTVFLVLNHQMHPTGPPILFETMVFGGDFDGAQERYSTWAEAEDGHERMLLRVAIGKEVV